MLLLTLTLGAFVPVTSFADDGIATNDAVLTQPTTDYAATGPSTAPSDGDLARSMIQTQVRQRQQHQHLQFLKYQLSQQHQQLQKHLRHRLQQLIHLQNQLRNQPISRKTQLQQLIKGQAKHLKTLKLQR